MPKINPYLRELQNAREDLRNVLESYPSIKELVNNSIIMRGLTNWTAHVPEQYVIEMQRTVKDCQAFFPVLDLIMKSVPETFNTENDTSNVLRQALNKLVEIDSTELTNSRYIYQLFNLVHSTVYNHEYDLLKLFIAIYFTIRPEHIKLFNYPTDLFDYFPPSVQIQIKLKE